MNKILDISLHIFINFDISIITLHIFLLILIVDRNCSSYPSQFEQLLEINQALTRLNSSSYLR